MVRLLACILEGDALATGLETLSIEGVIDRFDARVRLGQPLVTVALDRERGEGVLGVAIDVEDPVFTRRELDDRGSGAAGLRCPDAPDELDPLGELAALVAPLFAGGDHLVGAMPVADRDDLGAVVALARIGKAKLERARIRGLGRGHPVVGTSISNAWGWSLPPSSSSSPQATRPTRGQQAKQ